MSPTQRPRRTFDATGDPVAQAIVEVADELIMPRYQALEPHEILQKAPGDLVTVADQEAERELTLRLLDIDPASQVVGEEAVAADESVLARAAGGGRVWIIDPIDGTGSFARGRPRFAVMVALVDNGTTVASWIWQPTSERMFAATLGGGAHCNGEAISGRASADPALASLTADVRTKFLPETQRDSAIAACEGMSGIRVDRGGACGYAYPELATGELDFALFGRQYPWDHAAGALLIEESGGTARSLSGGPYDPTQTTWGLLSVSSRDSWAPIYQQLFE